MRVFTLRIVFRDDGVEEYSAHRWIAIQVKMVNWPQTCSRWAEVRAPDLLVSGRKFVASLAHWANGVRAIYPKCDWSNAVSFALLHCMWRDHEDCLWFSFEVVPPFSVHGCHVVLFVGELKGFRKMFFDFEIMSNLPVTSVSAQRHANAEISISNACRLRLNSMMPFSQSPNERWHWTLCNTVPLQNVILVSSQRERYDSRSTNNSNAADWKSSSWSAAHKSPKPGNLSAKCLITSTDVVSSV